MTIHIEVEELVEEFQQLWKLGEISKPSIDYATNSIHCFFEGEDVIIFTFKDYGFINDNRYASYTISSGTAGITIKIKKSNC